MFLIEYIYMYVCMYVFNSAVFLYFYIIHLSLLNYIMVFMFMQYFYGLSNNINTPRVKETIILGRDISVFLVLYI
jgi:hypothetical protein